MNTDTERFIALSAVNDVRPTRRYGYFAVCQLSKGRTKPGANTSVRINYERAGWSTERWVIARH